MDIEDQFKKKYKKKLFLLIYMEYTKIKFY